MRSRLIPVLLAIAIPAASLAAQRQVIPPLRGKTPDRPAEKPPLMPGIHDSRDYSRYMLGRFSMETYPMLAYLQSTGAIAKGIPTSNLSLGDGLRIAVRATPSLFVTTDLTSSVLGGPFAVASNDFGLRLKPWTAPRVAPFVDARLSWAYTSSNSSNQSANPAQFVVRIGDGDYTTGSGHGHAFAAGAETRLSARLFLTTTLSRSHYAMEARNLQARTSWTYSLDATRLAVGLRYNNGRWLDAH